MAYRNKHGWMIRNDGCIATDWGGAREGAGRPRSKSHTDKAAHSFWCSTEEYEYLKKCLAAYREKLLMRKRTYAALKWLWRDRSAAQDKSPLLS